MADLLSVSDQEFDAWVSDALERLWDFHYLGNHPLAKLNRVEEQLTGKHARSHLDRGKILSEVLQAAIEALRPSKAPRGHSNESRYYPILYYAYVETEENQSIARRLDISERTFYRELPKAIHVIAQVLHDWEKGQHKQSD
jgi:hypothetical protein